MEGRLAGRQRQAEGRSTVQEAGTRPDPASSKIIQASPKTKTLKATCTKACCMPLVTKSLSQLSSTAMSPCIPCQDAMQLENSNQIG